MVASTCIARIGASLQVQHISRAGLVYHGMLLQFESAGILHRKNGDLSIPYQTVDSCLVYDKAGLPKPGQSAFA